MNWYGKPERRRGRFRVHASFLTLENDLALRLFAKVVVLRLDVQDFGNHYVYEALSKEFEELQDGEAVPEYFIGFTGDPIQVVFQREPS